MSRCRGVAVPKAVALSRHSRERGRVHHGERIPGAHGWQQPRHDVRPGHLPGRLSFSKHKTHTRLTRLARLKCSQTLSISDIHLSMPDQSAIHRDIEKPSYKLRKTIDSYAALEHIGAFSGGLYAALMSSTDLLKADIVVHIASHCQMMTAHHHIFFACAHVTKHIEALFVSFPLPRLPRVTPLGDAHRDHFTVMGPDQFFSFFQSKEI